MMKDLWIKLSPLTMECQKNLKTLGLGLAQVGRLGPENEWSTEA